MNNTDIILLVIIILMAILAVVAVILFVLKRRKQKEGRISTKKILSSDELNAYIGSLLLSLGGISNITSVELENKRLKLGINDSNMIDNGKLRDLGVKGIVLGDKIKILQDDNAEKISKLINEQLKK